MTSNCDEGLTVKVEEQIFRMDSQSNALYDNHNFPKFGLSELSFNAQSKPKTPKPSHAPSTASSSQAASPSGRRFIITTAGHADSKKALEYTTSPSFLSPSSSFIKSKHHHSMKSLRLGR